MRNEVSKALIDLYRRRRFIFFTGDLGFMALEDLRDTMRQDFVNAGVAEQNMVSAAAGTASTGLLSWVYSIAPFIFARPLEQIRNDVCFHNLSVKIVGNGGGYGYGVMGATHHAIEDYGVLLPLPRMRVFIPAFGEDVDPIVRKMADMAGPSYLRLGRDEKPAGYSAPAYGAWRKLVDGGGPVMVVFGPLVGTLLNSAMLIEEARRPEIWVVSELPFAASELPSALIQSLTLRGSLIAVEEHVSNGGAGQALAYSLMSLGVSLRAFRHHCAQGYPSGRLGSQVFHRKESQLDAESIFRAL